MWKKVVFAISKYTKTLEKKQLITLQTSFIAIRLQSSYIIVWFSCRKRALPALYRSISIVMNYLAKTIVRETTGPIQIIDITAEVREAVASCKLEKGQITLVSQHTTAFININEQEPGLLEDMVTFLKRLVPKDGDYKHNIAPVDGRDNAHSHLMGLFMNSSETVPFESGKLLLGEWQSIFLVELDGPRPKRGILMQISGI